MADNQNKVVAQKGTKLENPEPVTIEPDVVDEAVKAQTTTEREKEPTKVQVNETRIATDERVDYAIVPPEGRGSLDLPAHALSDPRPEDVFASEAAEADSDEAPADQPTS